MIRCSFYALSSLLLLLSINGVAHAKTEIAQPQNKQAWSFTKPIHIDPLNISGIVVTEQFMALVTDEGNQLELFTPSAKGWQSLQVITLTKSLDEIDIEGVAWQAPYLYALGSHSAKRKKIKDSATQKENLQRLQETSPEVARQQLFRVELNPQFEAVDIQSLSLQPLLEADPILKAFIGLPSKENGIDLEGLAIDDKGRLFIGFRGPVLRGNIGTVLRIETKKKRFEIKKSKWLYFDANGRGVRGLTETPDGFLVLTGAVGDQPMSYQVARWNGKNALAGSDAKGVEFTYLCDLPNSNGKPEGIQFLKQTQQTIEFVIVEDGLTNGQPASYQCPLP